MHAHTRTHAHLPPSPHTHHTPLPLGEQWIAALFEPIRLRYYMPPTTPPIPFCLPERVYSADEDVVKMVGLHPEEGGNLIEVCASVSGVHGPQSQSQQTTNE